VINLTRLDNTMLVINSDLIESLEAIPDTIVCLTTGKKIMVKESIDEIIERVAAFKRRASNIVINHDMESSLDDARNSD
jgi:flagellar protein FlbD